MKPSRKRLLLVDDEAGIRATLPPILAKYGYSVTSAGTVSEALEVIRTGEFDLLICDLNIEREADGFTVIRAMREVNPLCVTIVLTGYPDLHTAIEAIHVSVDDYVSKPAKADTLVALLAEKLAKQRPKGRILTISYAAPLLKTWAMLLEARQYEVTAASDLVSAVQCCKPTGFDVLLIGSSVPLSEKQTIIQAFRQCCSAPVISVPFAENEVATDGADYHLEPNPDQLLNLIEKLTQGQSAWRTQPQLRQTQSGQFDRSIPAVPKIENSLS